MKYSLFRGCLIPFRFPEYEKSAELIIKKLDLDYECIENFSCCGSQIIESINDESLYALSARNLAIAQNHNINYLMTLCGSCTYILKKTQFALSDKTLVKKINQTLEDIDLKYKDGKNIEIKHIIELLNQPEVYKKLSERIIYNLDLKVAIQNPCMIFRPSRFNPDQNPDLIASLLKLCGISMVDYPYMDKCCGGTMLAFDESVGKKLAEQRYKQLNIINPDLIVTSCPNCHLIYNVYPKIVELKIIPSVFLTQLIAFCIGFTFEEVGLSRNIEKNIILKIIEKSRTSL